MAKTHPDLLLWGDIETTTLSPATGGAIIEVGLIVTDNDLREIDTIEVLIKPPADAHWEPWCANQHGESGLRARAETQGVTNRQAERTLTAFVDRHFPLDLSGASLLSPRPILCGNSVHFDSAWIAHLMPNLAARFHHRHLDVTGARLFLSRVCGLPADRPEREVAHTALADLRDAISDLRRYRALVLEGGTHRRADAVGLRGTLFDEWCAAEGIDPARCPAEVYRAWAAARDHFSRESK